MNQAKKKHREAILAQRISTLKTKKHAARPVQSGKRVSISHVLKKQ